MAVGKLYWMRKLLNGVMPGRLCWCPSPLPAYTLSSLGRQVGPFFKHARQFPSIPGNAGLSSFRKQWDSLLKTTRKLRSPHACTRPCARARAHTHARACFFGASCRAVVLTICRKCIVTTLNQMKTGRDMVHFI